MLASWRSTRGWVWCGGQVVHSGVTVAGGTAVLFFKTKTGTVRKSRRAPFFLRGLTHTNTILMSFEEVSNGGLLI